MNLIFSSKFILSHAFATLQLKIVDVNVTFVEFLGERAKEERGGGEEATGGRG